MGLGRAIVEWYLKVMKNYVGFDGRARRKEYWMFTLVWVVAYVVILRVSTTLALLVYLPHVVPSIAAGVRRMHDTNHSGWWMFVPIVNLIFAVTEGERSENGYGPDPKAGAAA
jgi:uncharacterized membrane protein YhaH (DUF805 family)